MKEESTFKIARGVHAHIKCDLISPNMHRSFIVVLSIICMCYAYLRKSSADTLLVKIKYSDRVVIVITACIVYSVLVVLDVDFPHTCIYVEPSKPYGTCVGHYVCIYLRILKNPTQT